MTRMIETIILQTSPGSGITAPALRRAVASVDAGAEAELIVRGGRQPWVVYRGREPATAVGGLVDLLRREIRAALERDAVSRSTW